MLALEFIQLGTHLSLSLPLRLLANQHRVSVSFVPDLLDRLLVVVSELIELRPQSVAQFLCRDPSALRFVDAILHRRLPFQVGPFGGGELLICTDFRERAFLASRLSHVDFKPFGCEVALLLPRVRDLLRELVLQPLGNRRFIGSLAGLDARFEFLETIPANRLIAERHASPCDCPHRR